ncbi:hypothetical protein CVT25_013304 [Psilocybe cyanescens]|uniref:Uncharacterized protein n=1 Tax=Psilocybe cyanescens TaxID=93625 RepID=A0A409XWM9_PSICY|nr:hypothetical protein CVT25_013304 [Psilocybe cyanescens]
MANQSQRPNTAIVQLTLIDSGGGSGREHAVDKGGGECGKWTVEGNGLVRCAVAATVPLLLHFALMEVVHRLSTQGSSSLAKG